MDVTNTINGILAEFAASCGLASARLDENGVLSLTFDEKLQVTLVYLAKRDKLIIEANVANSDKLGEGIFRQLISFNRHWYQFDLHFGYDEETEKVQLYRQLAATSLTLEHFENALAEVLDHSEFWQDLLLASTKQDAEFDANLGSMRV